VVLRLWALYLVPTELPVVVGVGRLSREVRRRSEPGNLQPQPGQLKVWSQIIVLSELASLKTEGLYLDPDL
jgi:hypothetical protein